MSAYKVFPDHRKLKRWVYMGFRKRRNCDIMFGYQSVSICSSRVKEPYVLVSAFKKERDRAAWDLDSGYRKGGIAISCSGTDLLRHAPPNSMFLMSWY
jgi:hypothetical protein